MNQELKTWASETTTSIGHCIERMKNDTLSKRDRDSFATMLVQLAQALKHDAEYAYDPVMQNMAEKLMDSFDALMENDFVTLDVKYDMLIQLNIYGEIVISEEEYIKMQKPPREDGRIYLDFINFSKMSQEEFDQYIKQLKNIGAKFDPELKQWYVEADWTPRTDNEKQIQDTKGDDTISNEPGKDNTPVEFKLPNMSRETFNSVKQEIKSLGAKFNVDKKVWYAERSIGEDKINQIRACLERHDGRTYLTLPKTISAEQFETLIGQIKQDGARYNPDKKAWYITEKNDRNKFAEYLPSEKPSIHAKLEQNRESIGKQNQEGKTMDARNKDVQERA